MHNVELHQVHDSKSPHLLILHQMRLWPKQVISSVLCITFRNNWGLKTLPWINIVSIACKSLLLSSYLKKCPKPALPVTNILLLLSNNLEFCNLMVPDFLLAEVVSRALQLPFILP